MTLFFSPFRSSVRIFRLSGVSQRRLYSDVHGTPIIAPVQTANVAAVQRALNAPGPRTNWTNEEISEIYDTPLFDLQYAAVRPLLAVPIPLAEMAMPYEALSPRHTLEY